MTHQFEQLRLRLVADEDVQLHPLEREFPTVSFERGTAPIGIVVDDYVWRGAFDLRSLDERVERTVPRADLTVRGSDVVRVAGEVLTRYQRFLLRRNDASRTTLFAEALRVHEALFDPTDELARADLAHALDTWQWTIRLHPEVGLPIQLAALFHDLERLASETRERLEHRAPVQQGPRDARQAKGAERAVALLLQAGIAGEDADRVHDVLSGEARRVSESEILLLNDADALSFLSLGSSAYVDYFGVAQTRRKVAYTLSRLGPHAKKKLDTIRLRPDVERLLHEVAA